LIRDTTTHPASRHQDIISVLKECEKASPYLTGHPSSQEDEVPRVVEFTYPANTEIVVVSDLHMASGTKRDGNYEGTENFFADEAFARFAANIRVGMRSRKRRGVLIINGDFVDLLRVVRIPGEREEFDAWKGILDSIGVRNAGTDAPFSTDELERSIDPREAKFGLKTNDYKSVWKLGTVVEGHLPVFQALADWINEGHEIIITKGNHDLEWLWQPVRDYARLVIGQLMNDGFPDGANLLIGKMRFVDDALLINGHLYIEHGQRYDKWTRVIGPPKLGKLDDMELNIPMGSFMNRYLVNQIEETYPFFDNVRPQQDILPILMREHLPLGLSVLFSSVPMVIRLIPKRYFRYLFRRVIPMFLGLLIPVIAASAFLYHPIMDIVKGVTATYDSIPFSGMIRSTILMPMLGYFLLKIVSWIQISEPGSLREDAFALGRKTAGYRYIVMGHTHNPEQFEFARADRSTFRHFNTGTWIPVIDTSSADVREDMTYTYLHFVPAAEAAGGVTQFNADAVRRWDDEALRDEPLRLIATT
jgi:UDP-2,3-diacylglucosamine pyrophosphatase LpxH